MKLKEARELKAHLMQSIVDVLADSFKVAQVAEPNGSDPPRNAMPPGLNLATQRLSAAEGAHGTVALGITWRGPENYHLALRIQRRSLERGEQVQSIIQQTHGEVDVRYVGRIVKRASNPLIMGESVGHFRVSAGTLGCFVRSRVTGDVLILSNNHVLADENRAERGDPILQPGASDGGRRVNDIAARLTDFVQLQIVGSNAADCAIAVVEQQFQTDPTTLAGFGNLAGLRDDVTDPQINVVKLGRTTGLTTGTITAFEVDNVVAQYELGAVRFDGQLEIDGGAITFSEGGDSGSVIVDNQGLALGLLFASSDQGGTNGQGLTYANHLKGVLDALNVDLVL